MPEFDGHAQMTAQTAEAAWGRERIDWPRFMSRHDLVWPCLCYRGGHYPPADDPESSRTFKREWGEGAFIGNGMVGAMISKDTPSMLKWELGRNDIVAGNALAGIDWNVPRVPIGEIVLRPAGRIAAESMRLSLWDAEAAGTIVTGAGRIEWRSYVHATEDCLVIDARVEAGERAMAFGFRPLRGISPRLAYTASAPPQGELPPAPVQWFRDGIHFSEMTFIDGAGTDEGESGLCVTAWKEIDRGDGRRRLYATVVQAAGGEDGCAMAAAILAKAEDTLPDDYTASHRRWWHRYYPASFVSLPDTRWESMYWIQMYKLASATREDSTIIDNQGPWLTQTPWPGTWWNLNVQLSYSPVYKANRLHLGESLIRNLEKRKMTLTLNALPLGLKDGMYMSRVSTHDLVSPADRPDFEFGNLPWALHCVWKHYKSCMDPEFYIKRLYPLLRASMNVYLHVMYKGADGRWHLPLMCSPEYPGPVDRTANPTSDCSYDVALFRWGCQALLEADAELGLKDPLAKRWRDVVDNLTGFACDVNGLMVGSDLPFSQSHRHFSHLLAIFPLHLLNPEEPEQRELIRRSVAHWLSFPDALEGYSYTAAACMAASMGDGAQALAYLNELRDYLLPNTMYAETGPVIETPLSSAEAIHYMLMQCWGGIVRVFPAVPPEWGEVSFGGLLAEGAFEITAVRKAGRTVFVAVTSLAGCPLRLKPGIAGPVAWSGKADVRPDGEEDGGGLYRIGLAMGETVWLFSEGEPPAFDVMPVPPQPEYLNYYGAARHSESLSGRAVRESRVQA